MEELDRGNIDVFVALLVGRLQAIEHLDLSFGYLHRAVFLAAILRHNQTMLGVQYVYKKLHRIELALDVPYSSSGF